ncbi:hypothetical protein H0A36_22155 [Endozoicomonas sp. SM1973]|uniref:Single-stranded DNA-binding protein BPT7 domain-containing protein n=1 Tax=Spartinivicinus marinus TaxID=2994442 RepID=A0A853IFB0_9GAMM|nr:hypothetical protein [Spartinivicinus marinus]MCX4024773.1 hypothetical protein [Spartinivicinus marinus]NYZ68724.1 hypothetical protein [Spartinivicinus marinus]
MAKENFITPRGTLGPYPHLNTADTKFDADGVYDAKLILSHEDAQPLINEIDKRFDAYYQEQCKKLKKKKLKKSDLPYEEDEDEGTVTFKFKMKAKIKKKDGTEYARRPALYDTKNNIIPEDKVLGQGSEVRISTVFYTWYTPSIGVGLTLQPQAVRVYKYEEPNFTASASSYGFDDEEEGFTLDDEAPFDAEEEEAETDEEDDGDF